MRWVEEKDGKYVHKSGKKAGNIINKRSYAVVGTAESKEWINKKEYAYGNKNYKNPVHILFFD